MRIHSCSCIRANDEMCSLTMASWAHFRTTIALAAKAMELGVEAIMSCPKEEKLPLLIPSPPIKTPLLEGRSYMHCRPSVFYLHHLPDCVHYCKHTSFFIHRFISATIDF